MLTDTSIYCVIVTYSHPMSGKYVAIIREMGGKCQIPVNTWAPPLRDTVYHVMINHPDNSLNKLN